MGFTPEQESIVTEFIGENDIPGAAVAIVRDNEIIAEGGFGVADVAKESPATEHTIWPICSITKAFTGVSAMRLVESGKLALDEPVQTYLPGFRVRDEAASRRMTTRLFLRHNSGLGRTAPGKKRSTRIRRGNPL